jgi:hypothetical protein
MAVMGLAVWCTPHFVGEQIYNGHASHAFQSHMIYQFINVLTDGSTSLQRSYSVLSTENPCGVR